VDTGGGAIPANIAQAVRSQLNIMVDRFVAVYVQMNPGK